MMGEGGDDMEKIEAIGKVDMFSGGSYFFRLSSTIPAITCESFEFYAEETIIKELRLEYGDEVKITFEKITKQ